MHSCCREAIDRQIKIIDTKFLKKGEEENDSM